MLCADDRGDTIDIHLVYGTQRKWVDCFLAHLLEIDPYINGNFGHEAMETKHGTSVSVTVLRHHAVELQEATRLNV